MATKIRIEISSVLLAAGLAACSMPPRAHFVSDQEQGLFERNTASQANFAPQMTLRQSFFSALVEKGVYHQDSWRSFRIERFVPLGSGEILMGHFDGYDELCLGDKTERKIAFVNRRGQVELPGTYSDDPDNPFDAYDVGGLDLYDAWVSDQEELGVEALQLMTRGIIDFVIDGEPYAPLLKREFRKDGFVISFDAGVTPLIGAPFVPRSPGADPDAPRERAVPYILSSRKIEAFWSSKGRLESITQSLPISFDPQRERGLIGSFADAPQAVKEWQQLDTYQMIRDVGDLSNKDKGEWPNWVFTQLKSDWFFWNKEIALIEHSWHTVTEEEFELRLNLKVFGDRNRMVEVLCGWKEGQFSYITYNLE